MNFNKDLFLANEDILCVMHHAKTIGWDSINEHSLKRILYLSQVLYTFTHEGEENIFGYYHFSVSLYGPYSMLVDNSIIFLKSNLYIVDDNDGNIRYEKEAPIKTINDTKERWIKQVIYILGVYGEERIFGFAINDPLYKEALETNTASSLDSSSPENKTIAVLNEFKEAFEKTLDDTSMISKEEYLELYFEYVFSEIIKK